MKKALLLVSILSISVFSTACINNFAVQELNNKAKAYMEHGDYQGAIERLKSSIDLDDSVFESHYNLAVAYTNAEDYVNAISAFKKAIELKPDFADGYYSLAVAEESLVTAINADEVEVNADGQFVKPAQEDELEPVAAEEENISDVKTLSPAAQNAVNELLTDAVANYNKYLETAENPQDVEEVNSKVKALEFKLSGQPADAAPVQEEQQQ